jgi:sugar phosphate isomerase/epimerase
LGFEEGEVMKYFVSVPLSRLETDIDRVVREGFHPEVRMASVDYLMKLTPVDVDRLGRMLERRSLPVFTHGPFFGLDVASLDTHISEYSVRCLKKGLEVTAALGGTVMVMHTGYLPQFSRGGRRHWFRNWNGRMPRIVEHAEKLGVTLALENTWDDRPEVIEYLIDLLPGAGAGICLDTGHLNAFSRLSIGAWWDLIGERVVALHLHDNDGLSDDHLAPGRGTFDFEELVMRVMRMPEPPLIDLEVDLPVASEGRRYLDVLFGKYV